MDFNSIGGQGSTEIGYNNYNSSGVKEDVFYAKGNEGSRDLQQIPVGKAFRGEVTDVVGNKVNIRLDNGQNVQARLAEPMNFNIGDKILFQVKSNSEGTIEIKPIINAVQGQEGTIMKALEAANMPINEKTVLMIQSLLREQMPINRNTLQQMYKQILSNNGASIPTLVEMNKLNIPITKENIGQFEAYKNYEHRLSAAAEQLSGELTELLGEISKESSALGRDFHMQLLQMFTEHAAQPEAVQEQAGENPALGNDVVSESVAGEQAEENTSSAVVNQDNEATAQVAQEGKNIGELPLPNEGRAVTEKPEDFAQGQIGKELSAPERQQLMSIIKELPLPEQIKEQILSGKGDVNTILKEVYNLLEQNPKLDLGELMERPEYHKLLKSQIQRQWFVRPEQLASGKDMEEFYQKLRVQTRQLESMLEAAGRQDSPAAKTAGGMKENIDFMNQINQMFTYVQIPLMMSGKAAHSDLYVFTKKKNLRERDGKVSALLHLDMEVLGSLDIYVELDGTKVDTQFKVADEQLVKMFDQNMDFLERRITQKGYQFHTSVEVAQEQVDFVDDFLARDHGNAPMQRFAFDVRA